MLRAALLLSLLLSACGETDDAGGCEVSGCAAGQVCFHDAYDVPGTCQALPATCDAADPCACTSLLDLCDEPAYAVCDTPEWADADLICG